MITHTRILDDLERGAQLVASRVNGKHVMIGDDFLFMVDSQKLDELEKGGYLSVNGDSYCLSPYGVAYVRKLNPAAGVK
jgi:hypothetical protein